MSCGGNTCSSIQAKYFTRAAAARRSWGSRVFARIGAMLEKSQRRRVLMEFEKARQRGILMELDDRLLSGIGVTREQARREAHKPFWK